MHEEERCIGDNCIGVIQNNLIPFIGRLFLPSSAALILLDRWVLQAVLQAVKMHWKRIANMIGLTTHLGFLGFLVLFL